MPSPTPMTAPITGSTQRLPVTYWRIWKRLAQLTERPLPSRRASAHSSRRPGRPPWAARHTHFRLIGRPLRFAAVLIAYASVTSGLVTLATHIINDLGYAGVGLMVFISGVIAIPGTEAPMLFAGFNVSDGKMTLLGIILAGVIGDVLGVAVAYWIARTRGRELIESPGST